jgi:NAD(P)-dependent dehydrogenase (short-subunit alcohol dehydrogenase family)
MTTSPSTSTSTSAPGSASTPAPGSTIVITGAGSGVGRAVAQLFARAGWRIALVGRRRAALEETAAGLEQKTLADDLAVEVFPCDVSDPAAVKAMAADVLARFGRVDVLLNGAGTNTPRRSWRELAHEDYHALLSANLHGAFYCVEAFLPSMRAQGGGTVININSEAGRLASPKAGVAYVASKFGLAGLTQSLNAEERGNGIRACSIFPGDIDTPILDKRPQPPTPEARALMLQSEDVAQCVWLAATLPSRAIVEELVIRPR